MGYSLGFAERREKNALRKRLRYVTQNHPRPHLIITIIIIIIIMTTTTPTPPPDRSRHRCDDDDDIDRILLEACPTLFEVDDDDDAVEDALGTIGIPHHPPADRNRQRADGKDGRGKTTNNGSARKKKNFIKAEKRRTTPIISTGGSDGSSSDAVARRQSDEKTRNLSHSEGASTEAALRDVVLKTMSENNNNNNNNQEEEEEEEDVEMGRSLRQENAEGEKNDGPSASAKSFGGSVDGLMKAAAARREYRPAMSENYSNDMNNSNDNCFDAFDLDDFMADFVPPEMSNVLKESDAQRKDRLRRNREAAQLSRARKKKQLEEFANAAKVFREQFLQSNALVGKLANENHVLRMHLAHLARFVTADAATEAKKMNLPSLPPPTLAMQYLQQQQQQQQPISVGSPTVSQPATVPGGKIMIPPFNPHAYAKEAEVKRPASKRQQEEEERLGNLSPSPYNNNNKNSGQLSNTNSPKRQRTKKSSVVATTTALALSTACVLNNTNKAATVVSRSGTAASIATNVGRLATRHLTALPDLPDGVSEGNGIIASPDLKQALEMNWTMPDQAEMEKDKHSKALAFASEAIKKLSFDNQDEDKRKVKEKTKEEMAMNLWSEEDKNDKETHTMLLDEEANKVDPWFAAFRAARMHDVIQKMSRVNCAEVFQYKLQLEEDDDVNEQTTSAAAANIVTINPETPEQRIARKRSSGAIPLDDGSGYPQTTTSRTAFQTETQTTTTSSGEDNNNPSSSLVSMLLPPWEMTDGANDKSAAAMLRRLTKTFIVMFSKETGTYTTYACRLPIANL